MSTPAAELHAALVELSRQGDATDVAWLREEARRRHPLASVGELDGLVADVQARSTGLGSLDTLLADDTITDILLNGDGTVWVERAGELHASGITLAEAEATHLVERIVGPLGLRADRSSPMADARLPDGSRVNVVVPPLAVDGPCVTIRRFGTRRIELDAFCAPPVAELLHWAVTVRANVLVSGGTGAGKTTLLNAMAARIDERERVITVEDAAELQLPLRHVVRLEARPPSAEGLGAVSIRDLVRNALRMRPDRLLVGEVRGGEALEMLQAMNTGHDGSLCTCHANSPPDALRRLETMVLLSGVALPLAAVREQIGAAVDLIVQVARRPHGGRRVVAVHEVVAGRSLRTRMLADEHTIRALPERAQRVLDAPTLSAALAVDSSAHVSDAGASFPTSLGDGPSR